MEQNSEQNTTTSTPVPRVESAPMDSVPERKPRHLKGRRRQSRSKGHPTDKRAATKHGPRISKASGPQPRRTKIPATRTPGAALAEFSEVYSFELDASSKDVKGFRYFITTPKVTQPKLRHYSRAFPTYADCFEAAAKDLQPGEGMFIAPVVE